MSTSGKIPTEKKRKVEFSDSSNSDGSSKENKNRDQKRVEKSLTNLQINMRELAEKIEGMMTGFEAFSDQFKANHAILMQDMNELKQLGREVKNSFGPNRS